MVKTVTVTISLSKAKFRRSAAMGTDLVSGMTYYVAAAGLVDVDSDSE